MGVSQEGKHLLNIVSQKLISYDFCTSFVLHKVKKTFGRSKWKLVELTHGSRYLAYVRGRAHKEDGNGDVWVRKAIGVQMIEVLDDDLVPDHKQGQALKYNKPNVNELNIRNRLVEDEWSLIVNDGVDVAGKLSVKNEFDYDPFERYYTAWEARNSEPSDE